MNSHPFQAIRGTKNSVAVELPQYLDASVAVLDFDSAWPLLLFAALPAVGSGVVRLSFPLVVPGGLVAGLPAWVLPDMPAPDAPELPMPELEPLMPELEPLVPGLDGIVVA